MAFRMFVQAINKYTLFLYMKWRVFVLLLTCVACISSEKEPDVLPQEEKLEIESFGVEYLFSDSAHVTARLLANHVIERIETYEVSREEVPKSNVTYGGRTQTLPQMVKDSAQIDQDKTELKEETVHYFDQGVTIHFYNSEGEMESKSHFG